MMFKKHAFQVKVVKDTTDDPTRKDIMQNIVTAQAYASIVKNVAWELAGVVTTVIVVKTACDLLLRIGTKAVTR